MAENTIQTTQTSRWEIIINIIIIVDNLKTSCRLVVSCQWKFDNSCQSMMFDAKKYSLSILPELHYYLLKQPMLRSQLQAQRRERERNGPAVWHADDSHKLDSIRFSPVTDLSYSLAIRDLLMIRHNMRGIIPIYTVPRYPDNHNPLLPLALRRRLGEFVDNESSLHVNWLWTGTWSDSDDALGC